MPENNAPNRRRLLKILGGTALLPVIGALGACSGDDKPAAKTPDSKPEAAKSDVQPPADTATNVEEPVAAETAASADNATLPALSEDDPQAKGLSYVEDATTVDATAQPRYAAGQACENCALYIPQDDARGGCSIFPGKSVNKNGWCSVYAPKA